MTCLQDNLAMLAPEK